MLYYLLYQQFFPVVRPFRLFGFVTFRTAYASLTALFLCMILGPWLIGKLRDTTGSYFGGCMVLVGMAFIGALAALLLPRRQEVA